MLNDIYHERIEGVLFFWFRRDLRLHDNVAWAKARSTGKPIVPIFIWEKGWSERQAQFLKAALRTLHDQLKKQGANGLNVLYGEAESEFQKLKGKFPNSSLFFNKEYEPKTRERDARVAKIFDHVEQFNDHLVHAPETIFKKDGSPHRQFTPYYNKWKQMLNTEVVEVPEVNSEFPALISSEVEQFSNKGDHEDENEVWEAIRNYEEARKDVCIPTTNLGVALRFGTQSVRYWAAYGQKNSEAFLRSLAWRDFFAHVLYYFPHVEKGCFKTEYNQIQWRNDEIRFQKWKEGQTGYDGVDAAMQQLKQTGCMPNRMRMVTASFLVKNLHIDWRWGEAYFAEQLLDYDLASNNGNWQWVAGTVCDSAPYFRIFNPQRQITKFDPSGAYVKQWLQTKSEPLVALKESSSEAKKMYMMINEMDDKWKS